MRTAHHAQHARVGSLAWFTDNAYSIGLRRAYCATCFARAHQRLRSSPTRLGFRHPLLYDVERSRIGFETYLDRIARFGHALLIAEKPSKLRAMKNKRERHYAERWERYKASLRATVEHPFRVIKRKFGYTKVHYRGLAKNAAQVLKLFALSNLWMRAGVVVAGRVIASAGRGNPPSNA